MLRRPRTLARSRRVPVRSAMPSKTRISSKERASESMGFSFGVGENKKGQALGLSLRMSEISSADLHGHDVRRLQALRATLDIELDGRALRKRAEPAALNR